MAPKTPNLRRRLEQWLSNPGCEANMLSALLDVRMRDVAQAEGAPAQGGEQSPFAIARGVTFERGLLDDGAALLSQALIEADVLPGPAQVIDYRPTRQGGPLASFDQGAERFDVQLEGLLAPGASAALLLGPVLRLPPEFSPLDGVFIPDVVVVRPDGQGGLELLVVEIKAYHDRGGHTDAQKLAQARAQAGLYVCVLRAEIARRLQTKRARVASEGVLVLMRPGSGQPSVRPHEDLRWQARQAEAHLEQMRALAASAAVAQARSGGGRRALAVVQHAPVRYREACLGFCDRATACHRQACAQGDPAVLGDEAARQLGGLRLDRAAQLLDGAAATSDAERDFVRRMNEASSCLRRVS